MGRSQMQSAPWHYEYLPNKNSKRNSKNCVYNTGAKCTCSASKNHGRPCVGENSCTCFDRCSFSRPEIYKNNTQYSISKPSVKSVPKKNTTSQKKYNPKTTVEKGNRITIASTSTGERIEIHVTDTKNPFYLKQLNEMVSIKGEKYKIVWIQKRG